CWKVVVLIQVIATRRLEADAHFMLLACVVPGDCDKVTAILSQRSWTMDKIKSLLLEALRGAVNAGEEQRIYRSGELPRLVAARTSAHAEAAAEAVKDGYLEIVRTEMRGKTPVEWAKATAKGISYLLEQDSPLRALAELQAVLATNEAGLPGWVEEI